MSSKNSNKINVPEARAAMDKFKMEAASEVGVNLKDGYNGDLSSREAGSVGVPIAFDCLFFLIIFAEIILCFAKEGLFCLKAAGVWLAAPLVIVPLVAVNTAGYRSFLTPYVFLVMFGADDEPVKHKLAKNRFNTFISSKYCFDSLLGQYLL